VKDNIAIFIFKLLISILLTLVILIIMKSNNNFKTTFYKNAYDTNISFNYFNDIYNKYIGDLNFLNTSTELVFNEEFTYKNKEKYENGVKIEVYNSLVPINESGIVVYIGEKEKYGNTIIIQRIDGIDEWYGNMSNINVKLYDYVEKGTIIGEVDKYLYLLYKRGGNILNYEEYIK